MVEIWFGIIERQTIHRGAFPSVRDLTAKIRDFITGWNRRKHPFIWTKTPDEILAKIERKRKLLSVIDSADDGVVGVADDRDVSRPRRLVAGGAWSSG